MNDQFLERMDQELTGWSDPPARLRQALEGGEFQLYIQPIIDLEKKRFVMAEVLIRLREEEALMLPPGDFLPVFEEHRMMPDLDRWVIGEIARRLSRSAPVGFREFSINLSGQTLADPGMPGFVGKLLSELGVPARALCFEITESDVLSDLSTAAGFAAAVRRFGCEVALGGFGRRSTSFAPLKTLQVDYIKVDGAVTRNILRSELAVRKMQAIVRVAEAIKVGVIAEFVEEAEVLAKLRALRVGYAQGFGIARPAPIDAERAR